MTVLGRILVIVNALFSLVAFGLILAVHVSSTNWHAQADLNKKALEVAKANADTYKEEAEAARRVENEATVNARTEFERTKTERDKLAEDVKNWQNRYAQLEAKDKTTDVSRESLTSELKRRQDEVAQLQQQLAGRDKQMIDLEKQKKELRDRAVTNEIENRSERERNQQLLAQNEVLTKELQRAQASGTGVGGGGDRNPPPEDVEGVVTEVDARSGYITISIGSDAGLSKGNTLEVYRLKPDPRYLGTLRIIDVRSHEAVAQVVGGTGRRGQIQKGDRVASNINARR
jgi:hypothetical protein